jgi:hypothetical protein
MEDQIIDDSSFGVSLNDAMRSYIQETAKWTYFLSILGFIFLGFVVIGALFAGLMFGSMTRELGYGIGGGLISLIYLAIALLYFFPILYLFRFSTKAKAAIQSGSDGELTEAFQNLKSHYKFIGILTIVMLGLYVVFFLFGGLSALMMGGF